MTGLDIKRGEIDAYWRLVVDFYFRTVPANLESSQGPTLETDGGIHDVIDVNL
jgi:hypothetical protein